MITCIDTLQENVIAITIISIFLGGCSMEENQAKVSDDVGALRKIVDIPAKSKSAHWEIFGTPEYTGGVPGPTDYMTLVAEIEPSGPSQDLPMNTGDRSVYIVPEAVRPWMSRDFKFILEKNKNSSLDLSTLKECHAYSTRLKQTGTPVGGFACAKSGRIFLYLSLTCQS